MILSRGDLRALAAPAIDWDEDGAPRSREYGDRYFSRDDGAAETDHVFIEGNDLNRRFAQTGQSQLCIAELGFGTGLNFLMTWAALRRSGNPTLRVNYWSVERQPLSRADLSRALAAWPALQPLADALLLAYPPPLAGVHRRTFDGGRLCLDLVFEDADSALQDLNSDGLPRVDAWYLDGFAPDRNPALWTPALFAEIAAASREGATIASYSAAGAVRRGLADAGFEVSKRPGYGRKRECIRARLGKRPAARRAPLTPWDLPAGKQHAPRQVLVVGAGLAGTHVAASLAQRGINVTILDAGAVGDEASGNPQGLLFSRVSHRRSTLADTSLMALLFAWHRYHQLFDQGALQAGRDGDLDGCLQWPGPRSDRGALQAALQGLSELAEWLDVDAAAQRIGVRPAAGGMWIPRAGWLSPPAVCRALLKHPRIQLRTHCGALRLARNDGRWEARDGSGQLLASAPVLIAAAGIASADLLGLPWLPLKPIRGQVTLIPRQLPPLRRAFCHEGYVAPALDGQHCIGATFAAGDSELTLRDSDHESNLQALAAAVPGWRDSLEELHPAALAGRVALRAATPDYLPLAGPVPDREAFEACYAPLAADARQVIDSAAPCIPGLYVSCGHGSRGLSYAALAAEVIASRLCNEPTPLPRELQRALAPGRFLLRRVVRGVGASGNPPPARATVS